MIVVKNLSKKFGKIVVLKDIDLSVDKGEIVALVGPSGSGKSTLLRSINFLDEPSNGYIEVDGEKVNKKNLVKLRQKVGMVFQHFNLFPHMTVRQNICYTPLKVLKKPAAEVQRKCDELLKLVNLSDKADAFPHQLSGGQKQRIAIARTLAMEPDYLLFDEPTSALDPENVREVIDTILNVASTGITCLIVTHLMPLARRCERVIFLDHGKILEDSNSKEFFKKPKTGRAQEFLSLVSNE